MLIENKEWIIEFDNIEILESWTSAKVNLGTRVDFWGSAAPLGYMCILFGFDELLHVVEDVI